MSSLLKKIIHKLLDSFLTAIFIILFVIGGAYVYAKVGDVGDDPVYTYLFKQILSNPSNPIQDTTDWTVKEAQICHYAP